jgi:hypothetical protein
VIPVLLVLALFLGISLGAYPVITLCIIGGLIVAFLLCGVHLPPRC